MTTTSSNDDTGRAHAALSATEANDHAATVDGIAAAIGSAVAGAAETARLALVALLCRGHILLEDVPGVGKTRLARSLAASVGGGHRRVQFTPDLLPSDLTGVNVFNQETREFEFHAGPLFANVVVADEINRASPKTQAALLEVMEEGRVTVDGVRYAVPDPFIVVATQNPVELDGTYRLPEAQLDRFLMRLSLGYPDREAEFAIMRGDGLAEPRSLKGTADMETIVRVREAAARVHTAATVYGYVRDIAEATRSHPRLRLGLSPRATAALVGAARTYALIRGRTYVIPEDVQRLAFPVWAHRLVLTPEALVSGQTEADVLGEVLAGIAAPQPEQAVSR